ncbi:MAG: FAD-dependent oxidoreductase, partial [Thermoleophilia bacterium]|nr:FAD-dependent oxidoreductase [Thermoleophilia bacterium]
RILEQMLLKEGVSILYHTTVIDAIKADNVIKGAIAHNKGGHQAILAKRVVDSSGDGDISAYAGAPFEVGCPDLFGYNQSTSLVCRIGNVDLGKYRETIRGHAGFWERKVDEAVADGIFPYKIDKRLNWAVVVPGRDLSHGEVLLCYAHSRHCRNLDAEDLTRQVIEQRQQTSWLMTFLAKYIPGFEHAWLIDTAPMLGVRDSRRIMGEYKLTGEDLVSNARFDDAVVRDMHALDAHHPTDVGHIKHVVRKNADGTEEKIYVRPGSFREIPYRALVPLEVDNLLTAGRNISCDFMGQSGTRLVLTCLNMGQAAGTAAALSIQDEVPPRKLNVKKLQRRLIEQGFTLDQDPEYGVEGASTKIKIAEEDIELPSSRYGSPDRASIREDKESQYYVADKVDEAAIKGYEKRGTKSAARDGYTDTGGDVGTNLE